MLTKEPAKVLPLLERALTTEDKLAVILEYADTIAPAGDTSFSTVDDRAAVGDAAPLVAPARAREVRLDRASCTLENLSELHPKIVSNPRVATVRVPMPTRRSARRCCASSTRRCRHADVDRLAEVTAGLKSIQIKAILAPPEARHRRRRTSARRTCIELLSRRQAATDQGRARARRQAGARSRRA